MDIYFYGIIVSLAIVAGFAYAMVRSEQFGLIADKVFDAAVAGLIGGFLSARLYYVILSDTKYTFITFFSDLRDGGLAIYGGVIGAVTFALIFMKLRKMKIPPVMDLAGLGFLLGIGIGRWGNFFNQEAYGATAAPDYFLAMTGNLIQGSTEYGKLVHPCFLYESLWCLLGFVLLHIYSKEQYQTFDGEIFLLFAAWYGTGRAFNEQLRADSLMLGNIKFSQILAIVSAALALGGFVYLKIKVKKSETYKLFRDTEESAAAIAAHKEKLRLDKEKIAARKALKQVEEKAPSILGGAEMPEDVGGGEVDEFDIGGDAPSDEQLTMDN
ncbi:MAG: prolipoprotein diacylglyceryl transferase [Oscillospiraceae bacterium]|nr:prolipoprotein diacylglyceryl transferase [Oscillospiraceae bacterium]